MLRHQSSSTTMFFAMRMTTMAFLLVETILVATLLSTDVSAFVNGPWQRHLDSRLKPFEGRVPAIPIPVMVLQAASVEEPATVPQLDAGATTESPDDESNNDNEGKSKLTIVPSNGGFRNTALSGGTEVSIASMNLLAPFYNSLQLSKKTTTEYERWEFLNNDRIQRVPEAINMAKRTNADVLCLQEIEGGKLGETGAAEGKEFTLRDDVRDWLADPTTTTVTAPDGKTVTLRVEGYDSFVWSPLNPGNKRGDMVGLCIAWRSRKHELVDWEGYKRGMVCRLREASGGADQEAEDEKSSPASFAIANLHLPARPSNVLGRLTTMSRTIRKLSDLDRAMRKDRSSSSRAAIHPMTIDGLLVVAGDFNSDQDSVAARLLSHGCTNYGNVRDRNYKAKLTKASAAKMSHQYRFLDSYDHHGVEWYGSDRNDDPRFKDGSSFRDLYAPVTVSLKGRGPGIMDHLFYATGTAKGRQQQRLPKAILAKTRTNPSQAAMASVASSTKEALSDSILRDHLGKRSKRRKKGEARGGGLRAAHYANNERDARITVEAVLATVDRRDDKVTAASERRWKVIHEGLPNREEGFPSDHLPVGVLFSAASHKNNGDNQANEIDRVAPPPAAATIDSKSSNSIIHEDMETGNEDSPSTTLSKGATTDPPHPTGAASNHRDDTTNNASSNPTTDRGQSSGVSASVKRRRRSSRTSFGLRRRHNVVLTTTAEWLVGRGATSIVLDKPLYKNDLLTKTLGKKELQTKLKKKSRAPDLVCSHVDAKTSGGEESLVVVEVAVASDPDKVRTQKSSKYMDLMNLLKGSGKKCLLATIVVRDDGRVPEGTRSDIHCLAELSAGIHEGADEIEAETDRLCAHLESLVSSFRVQ